MRGDAEVGKNCVYLFNVVITQKIVQVTEITAYKGEMSIVDNVPFGIFVLIKSQQPSAFSESRKNLARMTCSSKRNVYIRSVRTNIHPVNALF